MSKKHNGLLWRVLKIWATCLILAFCVLGVIAVKRVGVPVVTMYREASKDVAKSSKDTFKAEQTSLVYDAEGNEIKKLKQEKDVSYLDYEDIPDAAKLAIISIEDKNFTTHHGIDVEGVARAGLSLILNRGNITMGGSTITQQLARNIFLGYEKTYSRKIKEMFIAVALEQKYTKQEILEFYLNNVYFANYVDGLCGIGDSKAKILIKNNKEIYNNELFEFINKNEIDIVFVFGRTVYNNLPSCSKNKTAAEKQPDLDNGNLFVGKKRDFIRHCVYLKGEQHKNAKTMLKRDVHVYGLRHPSARCGFNAENYKPYLKNLI